MHDDDLVVNVHGELVALHQQPATERKTHRFYSFALCSNAAVFADDFVRDSAPVAHGCSMRPCAAVCLGPACTAMRMTQQSLVERRHPTKAAVVHTTIKPITVHPPTPTARPEQQKQALLVGWVVLERLALDFLSYRPSYPHHPQMYVCLWCTDRQTHTHSTIGLTGRLGRPRAPCTRSPRPPRCPRRPALSAGGQRCAG